MPCCSWNSRNTSKLVNRKSKSEKENSSAVLRGLVSRKQSTKAKCQQSQVRVCEKTLQTGTVTTSWKRMQKCEVTTEESNKQTWPLVRKPATNRDWRLGPKTKCSQDLINKNDQWAGVPAEIMTTSLFQPRFPHTDKMSPMTFSFVVSRMALKRTVWQHSSKTTIRLQSSAQNDNSTRHAQGFKYDNGVVVAWRLQAESREWARGLSWSKESSLLCWYGSREANLKWPAWVFPEVG